MEKDTIHVGKIIVAFVIVVLATLLVLWPISLLPSPWQSFPETDLALTNFTVKQREIICNEFSLTLSDDIKPNRFSYMAGAGKWILWLSFASTDADPFLASYDKVEEKEEVEYYQEEKYIHPYYSVAGQDGKEIRIYCYDDQIVLEKEYISTQEFKELPKSYDDGWQPGWYNQ